MSSIEGVIFDESLLLLSDAPRADESSFQLRSGASSFLRKLRHSKIRTGVSYGLGFSSDKEIALKRIATEYLCDCFLLDASVGGAGNEVNQAWGNNGGSILYVVSDNKDAFHKLSSCWLIIVMGATSTSVSDISSMLYINKLEELPMTICQLNKKVA